MRTIKASALTDKHFGKIVSVGDHPQRRRLFGASIGITLVRLWWNSLDPCQAVELDTDITIHDGGGG